MNPMLLRTLVIGILLFSTAFAADKLTSEYTSKARKKALSYKTVDGGFTQLCLGLGGYQLVQCAGDDRSWINLKHSSGEVDLYGDSMSHAGSQFPNKANDVVEWRGQNTAKGFKPDAIIYRISSSNPNAEGPANRTRIGQARRLFCDDNTLGANVATENEREDCAEQHGGEERSVLGGCVVLWIGFWRER